MSISISYSILDQTLQTTLQMKEDFLHFVWKYNYYNQQDLLTTDNQKVRIQSGGIHNHDSGPDFSQADIWIDGIQWIGSLEIHIQSSDWLKHKHQFDKNYDNVILHVVWEEDKVITNGKDQRIPCIELKARVDPRLLDKYENLQLRKSWIACADSLQELNKEKIHLWLNAISVERLQKKSAQIIGDLHEFGHHWEQVFFIQVCRAFGLRVNQDAFAALAKSFSFSIIQQYAHKLESLEALLYGQAGMLSENFKDEYAIRLKAEYDFIKHKHRLVMIPVTFWKFGRLRPANFPTIRIAQLAHFIHLMPKMFQYILDTDYETAQSQFEQVKASSYWDMHYRFESESKMAIKSMGSTRIQLLFINCISPMLFVYGKYKSQTAFIDKAISILESIPAETNSIIKQWKNHGIEPQNAMESQALIYLKKVYCDQYKCVSCHIGHQLLSKANITK